MQCPLSCINSNVCWKTGLVLNCRSDCILRIYGSLLFIVGSVLWRIMSSVVVRILSRLTKCRRRVDLWSTEGDTGWYVEIKTFWSKVEDTWPWYDGFIFRLPYVLLKMHLLETAFCYPFVIIVPRVPMSLILDEDWILQ